jgi:hypothetical protein
MRSAIISIILYCSLCSCNEQPKKLPITDKPEQKLQVIDSPYLHVDIMADEATLTVFEKMGVQLCNCTGKNMRNSKPSTSMNSCYEAVITKFTPELKKQGVDPASEKGRLKLGNEVLRIFQHACPSLHQLVLKEGKERAARDQPTFAGQLISGRKLPDGRFEVVLKDDDTEELRTFYSDEDVSAQLLKFKPGSQLAIAYEIRKSKSTGLNEYYIAPVVYPTQ